VKFLALLLIAAHAALAQNPRSWPAEAVAENFDVRGLGEDKATGATTCASPHFEMASDVKLPVSVVRDLAAVFEATRVAVRAMPLGLEVAPEPRSYRVMFFSNVGDYAAAGGASGSGGFFNGRIMLLLLPNLGIQKSTNGLTLAHQQHLFVLKHEGTHRIMAPWSGYLPVWLREGLAECIASTPYVRGRYTFTGFDTAMRDYLLKWRKTKDQRSLRLIMPGPLMALSGQQWQQQVNALAAYDHYNSAALLTHWFLHHDGGGDAAGLAEYFGALAGRRPPADGVERYLLRGRTPERIEAEVADPLPPARVADRGAVSSDGFPIASHSERSGAERSAVEESRRTTFRRDASASLRMTRVF